MVSLTKLSAGFFGLEKSAETNLIVPDDIHQSNDIRSPRQIL
jgi:hypothetical protein